MNPILIVISTYNRRDLTGITLDQVKKHKSPLSDVLIIDDASTEYDKAWLLRWGFSVMVNEVHNGVGLVASQRFGACVQRNYDYLCALDNDVLLSHHFDAEILKIFCSANDESSTLASGYHSNTQEKSGPHSMDWIGMRTINGINQFTDRATARKFLRVMEGQWEHTWDANISKFASLIAVPYCSLIEHIGIHGNGVNGLSTDTAVKFVGDGWVTQSKYVC